MKIVLFLFFYGCLVLETFAQNPKQPGLNNQDYGILYQYNDSIQYETYPLSEGWGYRIYLRYQLLINQPNIPAISGNQPFSNEADAKKIALLASAKIADGQMPPTLSIEEIQNQLKVCLKIMIRPPKPFFPATLRCIFSM